MIEIVNVDRQVQLSDYEAVAGLGPSLSEVGHEARQAVKKLGERRVWMISGAEARGALVENLATLVALLRDCGVDARWARVAAPGDDVQAITRRLRRLVLGDASVPAVFDDSEVAAFARFGTDSADKLAAHLGRGDLLVAHGLGVAATGAALKQQLGVTALWRNLVGLDDRTPGTRAAWHFLKEHLTAYDRGLFTCAEYIPQYFTNRASLVPPSIDPLSDKNRSLSLHSVVGTLRSAGLLESDQPTLSREFAARALRIDRYGDLQPVGELGLLYRPTVTQISRWDRLNGMLPLLQGFAGLKQKLTAGGLERHDERQRRRIEITRLVLAGPHPDSLGDDPELRSGYQELVEAYRELEPAVAADICLIALPTASASEHALIVNALQRVSTVVVQNSLVEGFGLSVAEAAFKGIPVMGSATSGIRLQLRHQIDGLLCEAPEDPQVVGKSLLRLLSDEEARQRYATSAQRRVRGEFLITDELRRFLRLFTELA